MGAKMMSKTCVVVLVYSLRVPKKTSDKKNSLKWITHADNLRLDRTNDAAPAQHCTPTTSLKDRKTGGGQMNTSMLCHFIQNK
jgi:hypothetical protein